MENTYTQDKEKNGGYMTLFASLLFLVMTALLFVCLDGILLYQGKSAATMAVTGAGEHLLANYDEVLASRYALYFLDGRMEPRLKTRTELYFKERLNPFSGTGRQPILDLQIKQLSVDAYGSMQEQNCRYFKEQITEAVQYDKVKEILVRKVTDSARTVGNQKNTVEDINDTLNSQEAAVQAAPDSNAEDVTAPSKAVNQKQAASLAQAGSPIKVIKEIFQNGVLGFALDGQELSGKQISPKNLPSDSQKEPMPKVAFSLLQNIGDWNELLCGTDFSNLSKSIKEKSALAVYGQDYFNYFTREEMISDTRLLYEYEYILGGQDTDAKNLDYVVRRMLLLRFALNTIYVLGDARLQEQALLLAGQLTGITGSPALIEGTKYVILCGISLIEAFYDVKGLLHGEEVPLLKSKNTFGTSISGGYSKKEILNTSEQEGLSYEDYLMLLFLSGSDVNKYCLRMQDLMQVNIEKESPEFSIKKCRMGITIDAGFYQRGKFIPGAYLHEVKENYQY